jgi:transposase
MLDMETRTAILRLRDEGHGIIPIARALKVSPNSVRKVLEEGTAEVPEMERRCLAEPHRERIVELHGRCEGNLVRVHEELSAEGISIPYSTLTGFCRREGIGVKPKKRTGHYHFDPGEEMQHDTSPHRVMVGGKKLLLQCASVVLCFSRILFAQVYTTFNRFYCKQILTEAIKRFGGAAKICMVDNTSIVIASGTGKNAIPAPEMEAFGNRFGFRFAAHEKGDANRSARVEGPFWYIERNFYPGRTFADLFDLNRQLVQWCEQKSHRFIRDLQARPIDLYQTERLHLQPLPLYIPEVYQLHSRVVNLEGNVQLHTNRYSVPDELLGRRVQVHETIGKVRVYHKHKLVAEHERRVEGARARVVDKTHHTSGRRPTNNGKTPLLREEKTLRAAAPELDKLVEKIHKEGRGRPLWHIRKLYRFYLDYPTEALCKAVARAIEYGLTDLDRIEHMTLRNVAGDYFRLDIDDEDEQESGDE